VQGILWGLAFIAACSHPQTALDEAGNIVSNHAFHLFAYCMMLRRPSIDVDVSAHLVKLTHSTI